VRTPATEPYRSPALTRPVEWVTLRSVRLLLYIAVSALLVGALGCQSRPPEQKPIWEDVKIGDIASTTGKPRRAQFLVTATIDIYSLDLPAANVEKLDSLWNVLSSKSIWMSSYKAFRENSLRVRSGRIENWRQIQSLLTEAGAQVASTTTLMLNDSDPTDWPLVNLPTARAISFIDESLLEQKANLGPGQFVLRLRTEPIPGLRGVRKLVAYPVHKPPLGSAIPELQEKLKESEFIFSAACFGFQMGPGDLIVLAPDQYTGEQLSLGGLLFNKAERMVFLNPATRQVPTQEPAVRVFIIVCTGIKD
jgi:hypothetical protein